MGTFRESLNSTNPFDSDDDEEDVRVDNEDGQVSVIAGEASSQINSPVASAREGQSLYVENMTHL